MVACHRRGRRPAASEAHTELCVCVSECERGKREGRAEGGRGARGRQDGREKGEEENQEQRKERGEAIRLGGVFSATKK